MASRLFVGLLAALATFSSISLASPIATTSNTERDVFARAVTSAGSQVVVDGAGVYMRATRLNDGNIIGGYAATDSGSRVIRAVRSDDGGASWQALGIVTSADPAATDLDNAYPLQLPSGRILFAFRNHDRSGSGWSYYRITLCYSDDGGVTWFFLTQIEERAASGVNGIWEPLLRISGDGTLQVYYSSENANNDQDNVMKTSTDGGATWSGQTLVSGDGVTSRDGMVGIANIDDNGNVICVFENTESGPFAINYVLSQDDGFTWNTRTRLYTAANGAGAGAPSVINVGGTLVVDFMTNEDGSPAQLDGGKMKVVTSGNGGSSWSSAVVTGETGSHWPGMYSLDASTFLALYSFDGVGLVSQKYQL